MLQKSGTPEAISESAGRILQAAWRPSTHSKYANNQRKWQDFCDSRKINPFQANIGQILDFLSYFFDLGHSYKTITGYTTTIKKFIALDSRDQILLKRFMKGVYNLRPPKKRHMATWDITIVLNHLRNMNINTTMTISKKLATLYMILAGTRVNSLFHLKITNMYLTDDECSFTFDQVIKHSRPGFNTQPLIFRAFPQDIQLCPVYHTKLYLTYRLNVCSDLGFFATTIQPYHAASTATISRWIKETLGEAGINTGKFTAHSCRSASTTAAEFLGIDIITIRKAAGWSQENTFIRHYRKEIEFSENKNFGYSLLEKAQIRT